MLLDFTEQQNGARGMTCLTNARQARSALDGNGKSWHAGCFRAAFVTRVCILYVILFFF